MRTHYGPWQPCWISNLHQKHKSGRGPSNEHFWQVWLKSVQRFQRRRFKCEKLTDGRRTLTHDKSSHGLWPGELKIKQRIPVIPMSKCKRNKIQQTLKDADPSCLQWNGININIGLTRLYNSINECVRDYDHSHLKFQK